MSVSLRSSKPSVACAVASTIPSFDEAPTDAQPSEAARFLQSNAAVKRRVVLKGALAIAAGLALNAISWLPPGRARRASAYFDQYSNCNIYTPYWAGICSPMSAYFGSDVCSGDWHKHEVLVGDWENGAWYAQTNNCNGLNAWNWYASGVLTKCSDGHVWAWGWWGSWDAISVCRTEWYV